jgi:hypothetical protein
MLVNSLTMQEKGEKRAFSTGGVADEFHSSAAEFFSGGERNQAGESRRQKAEGRRRGKPVGSVSVDNDSRLTTDH